MAFNSPVPHDAAIRPKSYLLKLFTERTAQNNFRSVIAIDDFAKQRRFLRHSKPVQALKTHPHLAPPPCFLVFYCISQTGESQQPKNRKDHA